MARSGPEQVHVTYPQLADGKNEVRVDGDQSLLEQIVVHTTKIAALEYAADCGHKYVTVHKGENVAEAIARYSAARETIARAKAGRAEREARRQPDVQAAKS